MKLDIKTSVEIAIGLLNDFLQTGNFSAVTHAATIVRTVAKSKPKEENPSQEELGQRLGIGRCAITQYESGYNRVSLISLYRIADILDRPIFDFLP